MRVFYIAIFSLMLSFSKFVFSESIIFEQVGDVQGGHNPMNFSIAYDNFLILADEVVTNITTNQHNGNGSDTVTQLDYYIYKYEDFDNGVPIFSGSSTDVVATNVGNFGSYTLTDFNFSVTPFSLDSGEYVIGMRIYTDGNIHATLINSDGWDAKVNGSSYHSDHDLVFRLSGEIGYQPPTQLQTTPIELDVYSSHAGFDAFGIGCDISLDADDNCDSPDNLNNQQAVYVASSTIKGSQKEVTIGYASDSPNTTGLGFFLKYDSSKLNLNSVMELFQGCIACGELVEDGSLTFGYASLFGEFPGSNEVNLVKVTFDIIGYEPPIQSKQTISINNAPKGVLGRSSILEVVYDTSDNNNQLSGLGMRVHFNSSLLSFKEITDMIDQDIIVNGEGPFSDDANYDNDPLTDQYMLFGWASLYNNWPNRELPTVLMNMAFNVSDTIDIDVTPSTNINFTDSSFTAGYEFSANSYVLEFQRATWDFDGDENADALTDGLMMIRYLFGLRAELVTFSAMSDNSTLSPEEVIAEIEAALDIMDIDADGEFNALTDGLLLLRYLFGLRDDSLTNGAVGADATRSSNVDIQNYLESHMPAN